MLKALRKMIGSEEGSHPVPPPPPPDAANEAGAPHVFARYAEALQLPLEPLVDRPRDAIAREQSMAGAICLHLEQHQPALEVNPALCARVLQLAGNPEVALGELARVISQDPALSAAVLRIANSAFFRGEGKGSETVRDAIARLGLREVARVASMVSVRALFQQRNANDPPELAPMLQEIYRDSLCVALGASFLAMKKPPARSDRAHLAGLLVESGRALGLRAAAELSTSGSASMQLGDPSLERALDPVHGRLGAELMTRWGLPQFLADVCGKSCEPVVDASPDNADLHVVRVVLGLRQLRRDPSRFRNMADVVAQSAAALQIEPAELRTIDVEVTALAKRATFLSGV